MSSLSKSRVFLMQRGSHSRKPRDVENTYLTGKFTLFYHKISLAGFHPHCNFLTAIQPWQHSYCRACQWLCCPQKGYVCLLARLPSPATSAPPARCLCLGQAAQEEWQCTQGTGQQSLSGKVFWHTEGFSASSASRPWRSMVCFKWCWVPKCHKPFFPL